MSDFTDVQCADGAGDDPAPSNHGMCIPGGVAIDPSGNLFVADTGNDRVMEIDAPLGGTQDATRVFGQGGDFTASGCNGGAMTPGAATLCAPEGLMLDLLGNLWVADVNNDRVVEYVPPFDADTAAAIVIGQGDGGSLDTSGCNRGIAPGDLYGLGADSLCAPAAVAVDSNIDLYVADSGNNRSMVYDGIVATPSPTPTATATATSTPLLRRLRRPWRPRRRQGCIDRDGDGDSDRDQYRPSATPTANAGMRRQAEADSEVDQLRQSCDGQRVGTADARNREPGDVGDDGGGAEPGRAVRRDGRGIYGQSAWIVHGDYYLRPAAKGSAHATIEITSSDPKDRMVKVKMSGSGKVR